MTKTRGLESDHRRRMWLFQMVVVLLLAGCTASEQGARSSAAGTPGVAPAEPVRAFEAPPSAASPASAASEVASAQAPRQQQEPGGATSPTADDLLFSDPGPPVTAAELDPVAKEYAELREEMLLLRQLGQQMLSGLWISQSLQCHLKYVTTRSHIPRSRRVELPALDFAAKHGLPQTAVARVVASRATPAQVQQMRRLFMHGDVFRFATFLGSSVQMSAEELAERAQRVQALPEWRRATLAWLTQSLGLHLVERESAQRTLPGVLRVMGLAASFDSDQALARADLLAVARLHVATESMSDLELYALAKNLSAGARTQVYRIATDAMLDLSRQGMFEQEFARALAQYVQPSTHTQASLRDQTR